MKAETTARVRQVQKFSRVARWVCSGLLAFFAVFGAWAVFFILTGPTDSGFRFELGRIVFVGAQIDTMSLKVWLALLMVVGIGITCRIWWLLRGLFENLARGEIYTQGNVRRLRSLGLVMLVGAGLQALAPVLTELLLSARIIDWSQTVHGDHSFYIPGSFSAFAFAGVVVLVSWIMDVGLEVKDEAEVLRRDAELVV